MLCIVGMASKNMLDQMARIALVPRMSIQIYPNLYLVLWIGSYSYIFRLFDEFFSISSLISKVSSRSVDYP